MTNWTSAPSLVSAGDFLPYVKRCSKHSNRRCPTGPPRKDFALQAQHSARTVVASSENRRELDESELAARRADWRSKQKGRAVEFALQSFGGESRAADSGFGTRKCFQFWVVANRKTGSLIYNCRAAGSYISTRIAC